MDYKEIGNAKKTTRKRAEMHGKEIQGRARTYEEIRGKLLFLLLSGVSGTTRKYEEIRRKLLFLLLSGVSGTTSKNDRFLIKALIKN